MSEFKQNVPLEIENEIINHINNKLTLRYPFAFEGVDSIVERLNYLAKVRKFAESKTNNILWAKKILSTRKVQEYLLNAWSKKDESKEIEDLMIQILIFEDKSAMSEEVYIQYQDIFKWISEQPEGVIQASGKLQEVEVDSVTQHSNEQPNIKINNLNELTNQISKLIKIISQDNNPNLNKRKEKSSLYMASAIKSLRSELREQDEVSEIIFLGLLFPFGYLPDSNSFHKALEITDYENLKRLLEDSQNHPLGIEAQNNNREKREAYLILQVLYPNILNQDKEKIIDFINNTLRPNLQSELILNILDKYNVDLSSDYENAVQELQDIINDRQPVIEPKETPCNLKNVLECLGLTKYYPEKLGREEVYSITEYSLEQNNPETSEQLVTHLLSNLISFNYEGRKLKITSENKLKSESEKISSRSNLGRSRKQKQQTDDVYPLDVVAATFLCCNPIIRQDLVQRLWGCKLAIPLVIQEDQQKYPKFFLWAIRSLVMKWKTLQGESVKVEERGISNYAIETFSFIRFDDSDFSKSELLNWVISENEPTKSHSVFFHRNSEGSNRNHKLSEGMIEVSWYLPKGIKEDIFKDIVSFTNLRGDARKYSVQLELIKYISSKIVILTSAQELRDKKAQNIVKEYLELSKTVVILLTNKTITDRDEETLDNFQNQFLDFYEKTLIVQDIEDKNSPSIRNEIRKILTELKTSGDSKVSLEELADIMYQGGSIEVDERAEDCQQGIEKAREILQIIQKCDREKRKTKLLPLQGEDWVNWATADKEIHRHENIGEEEVGKYAEKQEQLKQECRKRQFNVVTKSLPEVMRLFINTLLEEQTSVQEYFVRFLKLGLDELSREELPHLYAAYSEQMKNIHEATPEKKANINRKLDELDKRISSQSFGLEHLLREMGQIYSAVMSRPKSERVEDLTRLPQVAAHLLLSGYPLEIMDGDVSSVPLIWVEAVIEELKPILKKREGQKKLQVFVLSAMGIQSSGKSTLLNTMFGLQFAVSAGRCTKGVYLQPVKLEQKLQEKYNVDYIFVVDTEGLKSPELSSDSTRKHDNELSTFVIGLSNLTLIKLPGENTTYLQEMLPISVHAFLRMKDVSLHPKTKIVHRNVDKSSEEKLNTQSRILNQNLDKYRGELDKFWSEIDREFRNQVNEIILEAYTRMQNCSCETELSEISKNFKSHLSEKIDNIFLKQEQALKKFFKEKQGMYEDSMQQWENHTLIRLRDLSDKLSHEKNHQIEYWHKNIQIELDIKKEMIEYEDRIIESIRSYVQKVKKNEKDGEKQQKRKLFEEQWLIWMENLKNNFKIPLQPANIEKDTQDALKEFSPQFRNLILEKLNRKKLSNFDLKDFNVQDSHYQGPGFRHKQKVLREKITKLKDSLVKDISSYLQKKEDDSQPYDQSYVREIINKVNRKIQQNIKLNKNTEFVLTKESEIDLFIVICGYAIKRLEKIEKQFIDKQNPLIKLEKDKEYYFGIFEVAFSKENLANVVLLLLSDIIKKGISEKIEVSLPDKIESRMSSTTHMKKINDKQSLIASILISLANQESLDSYMTYIHYPEQSVKYWLSTYFDEFNGQDNNKGIKKVVENELINLIDSAQESAEKANQYIESEKQSSLSILDWIDKFRDLTKEHLIIKDFEKIKNLCSSFQGDFDFQYLQNELCKKLDLEKSDLADRLNDYSQTETQKYKTLRDKVVDKIIIVRIGCLESCPFCGEICISGMKNHSGSHETPYHRPQGVTGYHPVSGTPKLLTDTCPQRVAGESEFRNSDTDWKDIPYKDYRKVNDNYASWKINGDVSLTAGSYWKWFMKEYSQELAKHYNVAEPDIPDSWKSLTKEQEIEQLKKLI